MGDRCGCYLPVLTLVLTMGSSSHVCALLQLHFPYYLRGGQLWFTVEPQCTQVYSNLLFEDVGRSLSWRDE